MQASPQGRTVSYVHEFSVILGRVIPADREQVSTLCILHPDSQNSLSLNLKTGKWKCFAGCGSGDINKLKSMVSKKERTEAPQAQPIVSSDLIEQWHQRLMNDKKKRMALCRTRSWSKEILIKYKIGWNDTRVTIPVMNEGGQCIDVRKYLPGGNPKMLPIDAGRGVNLFPVEQLTKESDGTPLYLCEGESDTLCALSHGLNAVTNTGGAGTWKDEWSLLFQGKSVVIAYDNDEPGKKGAFKVGRSLVAHVTEVRVLRWPTINKQGFDITDFFISGGNTEDLQKLVSAPLLKPVGEGFDLIIDDLTKKYVRVGKDDAEPTAISSFVLKPIMRIVDPDGSPERLQVEWDSTAEGEHPISIIDNRLFASARDFRNALPQQTHWFTGSDRDIQVIRAILANTPTPAKKGLRYAGMVYDEKLEKKVYVMPDGVYSANGKETESEWVYAPLDEKDLLTGSFRFAPLNLRQRANKELVHQVADQLAHLHQPKVIVPMMGWFAACPFAEEIRKESGGFPILNVYGTQGSGKSETTGVLLRMSGWDYGRGEMNTIGHTKFVLLRLLASNSIVPIAFDEYRAGDRETDLNKRRLREIYNGGFDDRGRPDLSVTSFRLIAPVALVGETGPEDPATRERMVPVNVPPSEPRTKKILTQMYALPLRGFLYPYLRYTLQEIEPQMHQIWTGAYKRADGIARKKLRGLMEPPGRVVTSIACVLFGWSAMTSFFMSMGHHASKYTDEWVDAGIADMLDDMIPVVGARPRVALDALIEDISSMSEAGFVTCGREWAYDINRSEILLRLRVCVARLREWSRRTDSALDPLTQQAYRSMVYENLKRDGYVTDPARLYLGRSWVAISINKANLSGLDIGGFNLEIRGDSHGNENSDA